MRPCRHRTAQINPFADRQDRQPLALLGLRQHLGHFRRFAAGKREIAHLRLLNSAKTALCQHDGSARSVLFVFANSRSIAPPQLKGPRTVLDVAPTYDRTSLKAPRCEVHLRFKPWTLSRGSSELTYLFFAGPKSGCQAA